MPKLKKSYWQWCFSFQKFHQYMYGKEALVESDHEPLEMIVKKPLAAAPPCLQQMLLQLQQYSFELKFKPGKDMVFADTISYAYIPRALFMPGQNTTA